MTRLHGPGPESGSVADSYAQTPKGVSLLWICSAIGGCGVTIISRRIGRTFTDCDVGDERSHITHRTSSCGSIARVRSSFDRVAMICDWSQRIAKDPQGACTQAGVTGHDAPLPPPEDSETTTEPAGMWVSTHCGIPVVASVAVVIGGCVVVVIVPMASREVDGPCGVCRRGGGTLVVVVIDKISKGCCGSATPKSL